MLAIQSQDALHAVQVFPMVRAGAEAIWGGPDEKRMTIDATRHLNDGSSAWSRTTFGIEGLFFRYTVRDAYGVFPDGFDGAIHLGIKEVTDDGLVLSEDSIQLQVAPMILIPPTQPSQMTWAAELPGPPSTARFLDAFENSVGPADVKRYVFEPGSRDVDRWAQDHIEAGFTQAPGGAVQHVILRLPYGQIPEWPERELFGPDIGMLQLSGLETIPGNTGGNIDVMPPSRPYRLGRIIVGSTIQPRLLRFFRDQRVQPPIVVDTSWLDVGHLDEVMGFLPGGISVTPRLAVGSTASAFCALGGGHAQAMAGLGDLACVDRPGVRVDGSAAFFASGQRSSGAVSRRSAQRDVLIDASRDFRDARWRFVRIYAGPGAGQVAHVAKRRDGRLVIDRVWDTGVQAPRNLGAVCGTTCASNSWARRPRRGSKYVVVERTKWWDGNVPALITVHEIRRDEGLRDVNATIQRRLDAITRRFDNQPGVSVVRFPAMYTGRLSAAGSLRPGSSMSYTPMLVNFQVIDDRVFVPKQFGPRTREGEDALEVSVRNILPSATWMDDWAPYHRLNGGIHCATYVIREPFPFPWWQPG
jgi:Protein-arginine deiminase (PAD)